MGTLYSRMKVFHFKEKLAGLPKSVDKISPPIQIRIKPTNVCGHNCWYCAYRVDNLQLGKDMVIRDYIPKEKMMEIIDDVAEIGVKSVTFSGGGDPFHYPFLLETVKKLAQSPVKFASLTHGAKLSGEIADVFAHHGTWLRISIDGWDSESYAKYREVSTRVFGMVMSNMENFSKIKGRRCYLGVVLIVDNKNYTHVYEMIQRIGSVGANSIKISPVIVSNDRLENNNYHRPIFDCVKDQVSRAQSDIKNNSFEIFDSYHLLNEKFEKEYTWCPYIQITPVIGADCKVYSCHDKAYNLEEGLIGSIKDQRFKDFWFSDKNNFFNINPSVHCNHHCVMNAHNKMILEYLEVDKDHLEFV